MLVAVEQHQQPIKIECFVAFHEESGVYSSFAGCRSIVTKLSPLTLYLEARIVLILIDNNKENPAQR